MYFASYLHITYRNGEATASTAEMVVAVILLLAMHWRCQTLEATYYSTGTVVVDCSCMSCALSEVGWGKVFTASHVLEEPRSFSYLPLAPLSCQQHINLHVPDDRVATFIDKAC